ncbi:hypothetical protein AQI95_06145 [Streptomyces yokosukanensis]|uniref:Methyltransferase domain-containing protein n=1 Tax=Streptomyces yokosukanensis TaxID=67386 RepID=A0A124HH84_9ACTN|nr:hypothetical protein AQI95_06145 [Streptomyces yokosukanensis]
MGFWDGVYAARPAASCPKPNARLTETVTSLPFGDALDLGCGDGGDALWLARLRWHVTTVRAALHKSFAFGGFDLVCSHYLHTPCDLDRATLLRSATHALRPDGRLPRRHRTPRLPRPAAARIH